MQSLSERLKRVESPFNWDLETVLAKRKGNFKDHLLRKLGTDKTEDQTLEEQGDDSMDDTFDATFTGSSAWQKCSQFLTMSWLDHRETNGEEYLAKVESFIDDVGRHVPFIERHLIALKYVIKAMWAHIYFERSEIERAEAALETISNSFEDMPVADKAAIKALKSCVFMEFGPAGHNGALPAIDEALALVDEEAEWHFLKGKCLARERRSRDYRSYPLEEELRHLKKAVDMDDKNAAYWVYCGLSLKDSLFDSPLAQGDRDLLEKDCEEYLTQAALLNDSSAIVLSRIAKGLMPLKSDSAAKLLKQCVLRSVELLPDAGLVNHVAGNFYTYRERNVKRAISHLNIAAIDRGIFGAYVNLIDLKWRTSSGNIDCLVESFWQKYRDDFCNGIKALPIMANYKFFVKNNLVEAILYWRQWMRSGHSFSETNLFVKCDDMTKTLVGQILYELNSNTTLSSDNEANFRSFKDEVFEARGLDLDNTINHREMAIRASLKKMDAQSRRIVEPKLLCELGDRPITQSKSTKTGRELPQNWRQRQ